MDDRDYQNWLLSRLDRLEALNCEHAHASAEKLEQIALDVALLKAEHSAAEARTKRMAASLSVIVSAVIAFLGSVWQTYFHR